MNENIHVCFSPCASSCVPISLDGGGVQNNVMIIVHPPYMIHPQMYVVVYIMIMYFFVILETYIFWTNKKLEFTGFVQFLGSLWDIG